MPNGFTKQTLIAGTMYKQEHNIYNTTGIAIKSCPWLGFLIANLMLILIPPHVGDIWD